MSEEQAARRRRRSRAEAEELVAEFEASGMGRMEFCQKHELAFSTLARYQRRWRQPQRDDAAGSGRWVAVELDGLSQAASGLAVVLAGGRRIEVGRGFDARTLAQLVSLLEPA